MTNPGYVPRGVHWQDAPAGDRNGIQRHHKRRHNHKSLEEKAGGLVASPNHDHLFARATQNSTTLADDSQPRVEDFWLKDVFICNYDGRPPYCSTCMNFKPDRTHHCSEVDRCVRKMDHFCPWVGGIVSVTSFKFFIQFCFYAALFCTHTLVFMAYFFTERQRGHYELDVNWILVLAFAALFLLFSAGMFSSTLQLAAINSTTVENLSRKTKVWYLAVYIPRPEEVFRRIEATGGAAVRTIQYPRPAEEQMMLVEQNGGIPSHSPSSSNDRPQQSPIRTFAILESPRGFNPWDCGLLRNIQEVMGYNVVDWFLPVKHSPCVDHSNGRSMFKLGRQVEKLKVEAGLVSSKPDPARQHSLHRKKRRRRNSHRSSHGVLGYFYLNAPRVFLGGCMRNQRNTVL